MNDPIIESIEEKLEEKMPFVGEHRFGVMVIISIVVSILLVIISLSLYNSSGAAQLDLSRPGYNDVRGEVDNSDDYVGFSSVGPVDMTVFIEFQTIYNEKASRLISADAFSGDPLNSIVLGFDSEATTSSTE